MARSYGSEDHRRAAHHHAIRRAAERYGLAFRLKDVIEHEAMIRYGLSKPILWSGPANDRVELHEIVGEWRSYFAVYRPQIDCIVTYVRGAHEWASRTWRAA